MVKKKKKNKTIPVLGEACLETLSEQRVELFIIKIKYKNVPDSYL